ncbi:mucin-2-like isoform X2 [Salvelinus fontinalis]|uniref:mucin-2-like isoform X2 n=1 Tax=Salvelinus fontinalis TaxID=8038 RepID=UPI0024852991|nr:mucin-2-like isoform X2 [Salvelinus fontinalis]
MGQQLLLKLICDHQGALDYAHLADVGVGADTFCALDKLVENDLFSIALCNGNKRIIAKTKVRRCKAQQCYGCNDLHLCKFYLFGDCKNSRGRRTCRFGHDLHSEHNSIVLREHKLETLSRQQLRQLLLQNDNSLLPPVCNSYNKGTGPYGNCPDQEGCRRLHMCDRYIRGTCSSGANCNRCHDFFEPHPRRTLQQRGVPNDLMASMLSTYKNIQAMKSEGAGGASSINRPQSCPPRNTVRNEICLFFVKGDCKQGEKCWRVHFKMPYKWEVNIGQTWSALPENEVIERDFCDPSKIHSEGSERVQFNSMSRGLWEVRRLSTVSSVTQPTYVLTTEWAWFWEDEYGKWVQYASIKEMHRLSSITSEDLEKRYQEDQSAVVKFTAGQQSYELSFRDMTQKNNTYGTVRMVRRRPVFVSTVDAQAARSRNGPRNFRAVPGSWDKSAIPDIGYKTVTLLSSDRDYQKVQELFNKTMRGVQITSIERVQNGDLWEVFQWKRDLMKKNNGGQNSKELHLFHGTDPKHIDSICRDNFDWRLCGTNGTVYGEGSYFARDAKYSHSYTSHSGVRSMFACQVLVGDYTQGNSGLRRPPPKGEGSPTLYDSCVDNVLNPSIYVVFERHQVYPEFLIKYNDSVMNWPTSAPAPPKTVSIQSTSLTPTSNRIQATAAVTPSKRVPSTLNPSKTAATTSSNPTHSRPTSRFVHQSLPKPAQAPLIFIQSPVLMKPTTSSQLVDITLGPDFTPSFANLSHTLTTPASNLSRTLTTPASTPSRTLTSPASTPSRTLTTPASTLTSPASTPSRTLTSPASTPSRTLTSPASTPSCTLTSPASNLSRTLTNPASTPSRTLTTPASTPSRTLTTPASTPSRTLTTPASTPSRTLTTPASTPSRTLTTPASTPSRTLTTPASTPSRTLTTPASTPSRTLTTPASTPSRTLTTPASTPSRTLTTPASTPSRTLTTPASTPSRTLTTPASTPSRTLTTPASTPSRTLPTPASTISYTLPTPASTLSYTLPTPASTLSYTLPTPASTLSHTLPTPASTPSYTLTAPASTPSPTLTTPASTPSPTLTTPASTPSPTLTTPASTPSPTLPTPASTPSYTLPTPASTLSYTFTTPASTPSPTLTTPASTPSPTLTTPASSPFYTLTTPASTASRRLAPPANTASRRLAPQPPTPSPTLTPSPSAPSCTLTPSPSTPSYTFTTPASTPSPTLTTPASAPSYTFTTPASTPSPTLTTPASAPSYALTTPASTASRRLALPANTASRRLAPQPPNPSPTLTPSASTPSRTLSPLAGTLSLAHTRLTTTTRTLSASSTSHPLSPSYSLSTPYHTLSHSSYSPTYTQTPSRTSPSSSSNSSSTLSPSASNPSRVFSPSTGAFTGSPPESLYSVPTAQRRDTKEKNKCLLQ